MEHILAGAAGIFLLMLGAATLLVVRRGSRIQGLEAELAEQQRKLRGLEDRYQEKCHQADEVAGRLSRARDEAKKAKKKAYLLESQDKRAESQENQEDLDRIMDEALQEARNQARQHSQEALQAKEECDTLRSQVINLKSELAETISSQAVQREKNSQDQKNRANRIKQLEDELSTLHKKLQTAKRKARTDSQVYKVTKNKLDLAIEKIAYLSKIINTKPDTEVSGSASSLDPSAPTANGPTHAVSWDEGSQTPTSHIKTND